VQITFPASGKRDLQARRGRETRKEARLDRWTQIELFVQVAETGSTAGR